MNNWDLRDASRDEQRDANDYLVKYGRIGDFFVRASDSNPGCLGLAVKVGPGKVKKFLIQQSKDWKSFTLKGSKQKFLTLQALLDAFAKDLLKPLPCQLTPPRELVLAQQQQVSFYNDMSYPQMPAMVPLMPAVMPWEMEPTPESQAAAEVNKSVFSSPHIEQAQIELMQKHTQTTKVRIQALEKAIQAAQDGGDPEGLFATMEALGLPVPQLPEEIRPADSISAIMEQQHRYGRAVLPPLAEHDHTSSPEVQKKPAKATIQKPHPGIAEEKALSRKLSKQVQKLLKQRLKLEKQLAALSQERIDQQAQGAQDVYPGLKDSASLIDLQENKIKVLDQEKQDLLENKTSLEKLLLEQRLQLQEEQLAFSKKMLEEERERRDEERQRMTDMLDFEKRLREERELTFHSSLDRSINNHSKELDKARDEVSRLKKLHEQEKEKRIAAEANARQEKDLRERAEQYRKMAEDAARKDRDERERLERQRQEEFQRRQIEESERERTRQDLERRHKELEQQILEAERLAKTQSQAEKQALQDELEKQKKVLREQQRDLEKKHQRELENARKREQDMRTQAQRADMARNEAESALDDLRRAITRVTEFQNLQSSSRASSTYSSDYQRVAPAAGKPTPTALHKTTASSRYDGSNSKTLYEDPSASFETTLLNDIERIEASRESRFRTNDSQEALPFRMGFGDEDSNEKCTFLGNCTCSKCLNSA